MQTNTVKKHKKRKKLSFPQQNWMKLSESLSFDVYNMHAKAGKWVFRAPEFILKRGVDMYEKQNILIVILLGGCYLFPGPGHMNSQLVAT